MSFINPPTLETFQMIPGTKELRQCLGYGHSNQQGDEEFSMALRAHIWTFTSTKGLTFYSDLSRWTDESYQTALLEIVSEFLDQKGKLFWPNEPNYLTHGPLKYPTHSILITGALVQLFLSINNHFSNSKRNSDVFRQSKVAVDCQYGSLQRSVATQRQSLVQSGNSAEGPIDSDNLHDVSQGTVARISNDATSSGEAVWVAQTLQSLSAGVVILGDENSGITTSYPPAASLTGRNPEPGVPVNIEHVTGAKKHGAPTEFTGNPTAKRARQRRTGAVNAADGSALAEAREPRCYPALVGSTSGLHSSHGQDENESAQPRHATQSTPIEDQQNPTAGGRERLADATRGDVSPAPTSMSDVGIRTLTRKQVMEKGLPLLWFDVETSRRTILGWVPKGKFFQKTMKELIDELSLPGHPTGLRLVLKAPQWGSGMKAVWTDAKEGLQLARKTPSKTFISTDISVGDEESFKNAMFWISDKIMKALIYHPLSTKYVMFEITLIVLGLERNDVADDIGFNDQLIGL
ncbi:hypothetical protein BKA56DRAFT_668032 [Ilyonectria sp. MPI-CAGE-AT-0026]|nr:hypothetical protein BKA56DRAFT_668032 [Ilyonectria sp. MPI-CAGE-AT-0026]